ncbi:MAG TPA: hypothetical protein PKH16_00065 [Aequorivita sp.]|nr:hypothetical protein [Aequorivita sp.]
MKNSRTLQSANNSKDTLRFLKAIRQLIKIPSRLEIGRELLDSIICDFLEPDQKVLYHYVYGRYHANLYKENNDIEELETANDFLDDMISIAFEHKVKIRDPRMHFTRAHVKYQLAHLVWEEERKPWLLEKARHITQSTLRFHPDNSSFIWLQQQLRA